MIPTWEVMFLIRESTLIRLMRDSIWYYKTFFYLMEVYISNAHILERKSPNHTTRTALDFTQGNSLSRDT